jgi:hypothetical protein
MLKVLIGTGVLLMAVGFGAAGWQYWQTMPRAEAAAESGAEASPAGMVEAPAPEVPADVPAAPRQGWLISPTGGLIPQDDVRAFLAQDRFVEGRILKVTRQATLASLLAEGEKLPEPPFLQVLADIRAPKVAEGLCAVLTQSIAQDCAVHSARVVEDSVDPAAGTARFRLELAYRLKDSGTDLPDLAAHVLQTDIVRLDLDAGAEGTASPDAALEAALAAVAAACDAETVGEACRLQRLDLDWTPGQKVSARAKIAWLDPLPKGMFVAPPLDTASGG